MLRAGVTNSQLSSDGGVGSSIPIPMDPFPEPAWRTPNTLEVHVIPYLTYSKIYFDNCIVAGENSGIY